MVQLDRALVSSYRLSIVTMSLTAAVWPQFATQVFRGGIGRLTFIGSYVNKQARTFTFRAQATTCSKLYYRIFMDAGCEYGRLTPATAGLLLRYSRDLSLPLDEWMKTCPPNVVTPSNKTQHLPSMLQDCLQVLFVAHVAAAFVSVSASWNSGVLCSVQSWSTRLT